MMSWSCRRACLAAAALAAVALVRANSAPDSFRFVILGDRTGEAQPGVYEEVWREAAAESPAFVVSVGDSIQGLRDAAAEAQWKEFQAIVKPYARFPLYLTPGNHDIWSPVSESLFRQYAGRPLHYSFDFQQAHFTVLDNSRSDDLSPGELQFLESDLQRNQRQTVKFVFSHRPSWLVNAAIKNPAFPLHQLARRYGVQNFVAGHVHQILHTDMDGVSYLSMPSSGGDLRLSRKYADGWFFGYTLVEVSGTSVRWRIKELSPPYGHGRVTSPRDWGITGLLQQ